MDKSRTIQVEEIARRLNTCERLVYQMLNEGKIPALRIGRKWLISRVRYEEWERTFGNTEQKTPARSAERLTRLPYTV